MQTYMHLHESLKAANLQDFGERSQMKSGFPGNVCTDAQDWGQFLMDDIYERIRSTAI